MNNRLNFGVMLGLLAALAAPAAQAALQGRDVDLNQAGYEAYYDDVLNITWLADANLAYSSGYSTAHFGEMTWQDTQGWIASSVNANGGLYGVSDWRLPTTQLANGSSFSYNSTSAEYYTGASDYSINRQLASSELGYMYYVNLGLLAHADTSGQALGSYGLQTPGVVLSQTVTGGYYNALQLADLTTAQGQTFLHVSADAYWTGTALTNDPVLGSGQWALALYSYNGLMDAMETTNTQFTNEAAAWLVTDGDKFGQALAVPEPGKFALMLAGIGLIGLKSRRARRNRLAD